MNKKVECHYKKKCWTFVGHFTNLDSDMTGEIGYNNQLLVMQMYAQILYRLILTKISESMYINIIVHKYNKKPEQIWDDLNFKTQMKYDKTPN